MTTRSEQRRRAVVEAARELPAIANYIRQGRCALFVGAGLSKEAGYPLWPELIDSLIKRVISELGTVQRPRGPRRAGQVSINNAADAAPKNDFKHEKATIAATAQQLRKLAKAGRLLEAADQCRALVGPGRFVVTLRDLLPKNAKPTPTHRSIVQTPYACVLTTNFDTLIEDAYAIWGRHGRPKAPTGTELTDHGTLLLDRTFFVLKAHGSLEDSSSLIFTSDDYRRISFDTPAFQAMLSAIFLNYAVLFVGYSLGDPNFRLLFDTQLTTFTGDVPPRYAIMSGLTQIEREILWRTTRIRTIGYPDGQHALVGAMLAHLARETAPQRAPNVKLAHRTNSHGPASSAPGFTDALYLRVASRGVRLDITWTTDPAYAKAWRDSDTGAETTIDVGKLFPFERLRTRMPPYSYEASRADVVAIGALLADAMPDALMHELTQQDDQAPVVLSLSAENEWFPWEWMLVEGTPLAERRPLVRAPVRVRDASRGRVYVTPPLQALVLGDPGSGHPSMDDVPADLREDVRPLPGTRAEAEQVARILRKIPGARVRVLLGADATYQNVMHEVRSRDYDIIHFAGHAWFDDRESYLALHDGRVWESELGSLLQRRPPALMVMNSHFTSFIPLLAPRRILGVAPRDTMPDQVALMASRVRGFTRLANRIGVADFVGCMGEPSDGLAAQFAIEMYKELALNGANVATAVLQARRATIDPNDVTALLYTHSGYGDTVLCKLRLTR